MIMAFHVKLALKWLSDPGFLFALAEADLTEMVRTTGLYASICDFVRNAGGREVELHMDPKSPLFIVEAKIADKPSIEFLKRFGKALTDLLRSKITEEKWDSIRIV
jgi:hypothetical protein